MKKHSPGKWVAECVGHGGPGDNPVEVWEVTNGHARIAEYLTEADARLVAAAPEMRAALQMVCDSGVALSNEIEAAMLAALDKADRA